MQECLLFGLRACCPILLIYCIEIKSRYWWMKLEIPPCGLKLGGIGFQSAVATLVYNLIHSVMRNWHYFAILPAGPGRSYLVGYCPTKAPSCSRTCLPVVCWLLVLVFTQKKKQFHVMIQWGRWKYDSNSFLAFAYPKHEETGFGHLRLAVFFISPFIFMNIYYTIINILTIK